MLHHSRVRKADAGDEDDLMAMCRELHRENGLFAMNEDKVRGFLRRAFEAKGAIIGVVGERNKLQASVYLLISNFWYSDEWHLEELFLFVRKQFRRSRNAVELIGFSKRCAKELDIPLVIGVLSNTLTEQKVRLYERQLSKPAGNFFVFNSKWHNAYLQTTEAGS